MTRRCFSWRILFIAVAVTAAFGGLGARLAFLHLGPNEELRKRVLKRHVLEKTIKVERGRILDRNGDVLAMDLATKDVCADPKVILEGGHLRFIASHLARLLQLDPAVLMTRLNRKNRRFAYVKRYVPPDMAEHIRQMKLTGIFFEETSSRNYPGGAMMTHVIGFSNVEGVGSAGVEQRFDSWLRGTEGVRFSEKDGRRREIYGRRSLEIPAQEGADVMLTLDGRIQHYVEKALREAMEEHQAAGAWAVVQRVRTGEILAMASLPDYDLNEYRTSTPELRRNRAITFNYEPGSTFKVAIIAAALNEGVVTPDEMIDCENGMWYYGGRSLRDYHAYDHLSVADVLKKSSNIGAAKIALRLGDEKLENYLRNFGVGRSTGVDLPGDEAGILHSRSKWSGISVTRLAMGHEVTVTALQMLSLVSALANDGFLMRPHVVGMVKDHNGRTIFKAEPEVVGRPITQETAAVMRGLMARVTEEGGTGTRAALNDYTVAGKTGSAQKPIPGGYSDTAHMASFVGFLPAENPEISIIVVIDEPQPIHTGGRVAAPVFKKIAKPVMHYLASRPSGWKTVGVQDAGVQL